jgi:hypothetical protein
MRAEMSVRYISALVRLLSLNLDVLYSNLRADNSLTSRWEDAMSAGLDCEFNPAKTGYSVHGISLASTWKLDNSEVPALHFPFAYVARHYVMPLHSTALFEEITDFITTLWSTDLFETL